MNKLIFGFVAVLLVIAAFFFLRPRLLPGIKTPETAKNIAPTPIMQTPNIGQVPYELSPEEIKHIKTIEENMKRMLVYATDTKVPPPCPEGTHLDGEYCRKGASKDDADLPYIGRETVRLELSCRPDQCNVQCKKRCEDASGETCTLIEDIHKECLKEFPPLKASVDPAELREQGIQCYSDYQELYKHYRCTYLTSEYELVKFKRSASDDECRQLYEEYEKCKSAFPQEGVSGREANTENPGIKRCNDIFNVDFVPSRCEVVYDKDTGSPFGKAATDEIFCSFSCI